MFSCLRLIGSSPFALLPSANAKLKSVKSRMREKVLSFEVNGGDAF
jgi:hypothetical protein